MSANLLGGDAFIVIVIALVVLVGGSQLPKIARNVGLAGREFKQAQADSEAETEKSSVKSLGQRPDGPRTTDAPAGPSTGAQVAAAPNPEELISFTPAQLDALLKARETRAQG